MTDPTPEPPAEETPRVTTKWVATSDIPPSAWAAMTADIRDILAVTAAGGATVTNPEGTGVPSLTANQIAFTVTTPGAGPLTVDITRTAGSGQVETAAVHTTGLVYLTMLRATRHWGALVRTSTGAGTEARAFGDALNEHMFGARDRALDGTVEIAPLDLARGIVRTTFEHVANFGNEGLESIVDFLTATIAALTAERDGRAAAAATLPTLPA